MTAHPFFKLTSLLSAALLTLIISGCGSGSGDSAPSGDPGATAPPPDSASCSSDCGTVLVGLTDADGDFLNYVVSVDSISLKRADGVDVEILPQSTVVDFAQYTELTEFLTAAATPPGVYTNAEITLDFAGSEVLIERDGVPEPAAVVDANGQQLGKQVFRLALAESNQLRVRPGLQSVLIIDFDLAASHQVDLTTTPITATADPFLLADIDPVDTKPMRVRGPLIRVDQDSASYLVALRPFWRWDGDFGRLRVNTTDDTTFEINGEPFSGAEGIAAMAQLNQGTATVAFGILNVAERRFIAREVYAGSSVPGHSADIVRGVVRARTDDILTVFGATLVRPQGQIIRSRSIDIILGPGTGVSKAGVPDFDGDKMAVSVGQPITAFGRLASDNPDNLVLDASDGRVRMSPSVITGLANTVSDGQLNINLQKIAGRNVAIYNFAGTGQPGMDADPQDYEVATANLNLSGISVGAPIKAAGFVSPFGLAPPDFQARSVADFSNAPAFMAIGWNPDTAAAFVTVGPEGLAINLDNPDFGTRHHLVRRGILTDLLSLSTGAAILPSDQRGLYALKDQSSIRIYNDFSRFTDDLAQSLGAGALADHLRANGTWSDSNGELEARRVVIRLN